MSFVEYIGFFGAFLSAITFVPQVFKAWQTKKVDDLSIWMLLLVCSNTSVWLTYGLLIRDLPVIAANAFVLSMSLTLVFFKFKFKQQ